jgi:hypothetical protein
MGVIVGNFLGLIVVLIAAAVGYPSLSLATQVFLGIAYGLWIIILITDVATRPKIDTPFCRTLEPEEQTAYRRYHEAIDFLLAGQVYSGWLNFLRVAGLVFAGLCVWKELYELAGASVLLFVVTASLIHRHNPWYYLGRQAEQGRAKARAELALIQRVFRLRHGEQKSPDDSDVS